MPHFMIFFTVVVKQVAAVVIMGPLSESGFPGCLCLPEALWEEGCGCRALGCRNRRGRMPVARCPKLAHVAVEMQQGSRVRTADKSLF